MKLDIKICKEVYNYYELPTSVKFIGKPTGGNATKAIHNAKGMSALLISELTRNTYNDIRKILGYSYNTGIGNRIKKAKNDLIDNEAFKKDYDYLYSVCRVLDRDKEDLIKEKEALLDEIKELEEYLNSLPPKHIEIEFVASLHEAGVHYAFDTIGNEYTIINGKCDNAMIEKEYKKRGLK